MRDAASSRVGGGGGGGGGGRAFGSSVLDETSSVLTEELKKQLADKMASPGGYCAKQDRKTAADQEEMGPIRIRNLEDLIRLVGMLIRSNIE